MTIEVRQMVIKSSVGDDDTSPARKRDNGCGGEKNARGLKEEVLAECRTALLEQLERLRER